MHSTYFVLTTCHLVSMNSNQSGCSIIAVDFNVQCLYSCECCKSHIDSFELCPNEIVEYNLMVSKLRSMLSRCS